MTEQAKSVLTVENCILLFHSFALLCSWFALFSGSGLGLGRFLIFKTFFLVLSSWKFKQRVSALREEMLTIIYLHMYPKHRDALNICYNLYLCLSFILILLCLVLNQCINKQHAKYLPNIHKQSMVVLWFIDNLREDREVTAALGQRVITTEPRKQLVHPRIPDFWCNILYPSQNKHFLL